MKEDVKLFLEDVEIEMLAKDETTQYVTYDYICDFLFEDYIHEDDTIVDDTIEEFYHTLTDVCGDYGFELEKTNKTNHMWSAHETKHFDIILTKIND